MNQNRSASVQDRKIWEIKKWTCTKNENLKPIRTDRGGSWLPGLIDMTKLNTLKN